MIYRISYVVGDDSSPGIIKNQETRPQIGEQVLIGDSVFTITEVTEVIPPKNNEAFLLVTLAPQQARR